MGEAKEMNLTTSSPRQRGNVTLAALALWLMLNTCALGMIYQAQKRYWLTKARGEQYLCLRYLTTQTSNVVDRI